MLRDFSFSSYTFKLRAEEEIRLPEYKGSTLRGGFGHAFKRVVCALRTQECEACLLKEKCVYSYVFETPPPEGSEVMRKYEHAPHPFIILPPLKKKQNFVRGDELEFGLTLIGRAVDFLPYFVYTFEELGQIGIGKGRGKYRLEEVFFLNGSSEPASIYSSETRKLISHPRDSFDMNSEPVSKDSRKLTLEFKTPTRLKFNNDLVLDLEFHILIRNLLRRLSMLSYFHCGQRLDLDFKGIIDQARGVQVKKKNLRWFDWERYSARQDTRMNLGGFLGKVTFEGDLEPFMPLIKAGEVVHVGKGTSFGLGKYVIKGEV